MIKKIFYFYYALFPLLAIGSIAFDNELLTYIISDSFVNFESESGGVLFHFWSHLGLFVSASFGLILVNYISFPNNKWLALFIVFDAPVQILFALYQGVQFDLASFFVFDFIIETIGLVSVFIIMSIKKPKTEDDISLLWLLTAIYGFIILTGYYGKLSLEYFNQMESQAQVQIVLSILINFFFTFTIFSSQKTDKDNKQANKIINDKLVTERTIETVSANKQNSNSILIPGNLAAVAMMLTWALQAWIWIKWLFVF